MKGFLCVCGVMWGLVQPGCLIAAPSREESLPGVTLEANTSPEVAKWLKRIERARGLEKAWGGSAFKALCKVEDATVVPGFLELMDRVWTPASPEERIGAGRWAHLPQVVIYALASRWLIKTPSDPAAFPALLKLFLGSDQPVRESVERIFSQMLTPPDAAMGGNLLCILEKEPERERFKLALLPLILHKDAWVRRISVMDLTPFSGDPAVYQALAQSVMKEADVGVRTMATQGIAQAAIHRPEGLHALTHAIKDPEPAIRRMAAVNLSHWAEPESLAALRQARRDADPLVARTVWVELARLGDASALLEAAEWPRPSPDFYLDAQLFQLVWAARDRPKLRPLITAEWLQRVLKQPRSQDSFRSWVLSSVMKIPDPMVMPALKTLLLRGLSQDSSVEERELAVGLWRFIAPTQGPRERARLQKTLEESPHAALRAVALQSLPMLHETLLEAVVRQAESEEAKWRAAGKPWPGSIVDLEWYSGGFYWVSNGVKLSTLIQALLDPAVAPRLWALAPATRVAILYRLEDEASLAPSLWRRAFLDPEVGETAVESLGWLGPTMSASVLLELVKHESPRVRFLAVKAAATLPRRDAALDYWTDSPDVSPEMTRQYAQQPIMRWVAGVKLKEVETAKQTGALDQALTQVAETDPIPQLRLLAAWARTIQR